MIMAGGRATRFGYDCEKAAIELDGKTLLERSLKKLDMFDLKDIFVSVSPKTPKTVALCRQLQVRTLQTSGLDYHHDIYLLLEELGNFVSLNVDSPFISQEDIQNLIDVIGDVSISVVVPRNLVKFPVDEQSIFEKEGSQYVWLGLNYVTPSKELELLESRNWLGALNINTPTDLILALEYIRNPPVEAVPL
ncbi:MAG: NTP transferase domain-containing protein [Thermoplasmata archaeon]